MVSESQHTAWRKNIMDNLAKAMEAGDDGVRREVALAAVQATATVMIAERIGQLVWAISQTDEVLAESHDRVTTGEQVMDRLVKALQNADEETLPEGITLALTMAEDWLSPDGPVQFTPPSPAK